MKSWKRSSFILVTAVFLLLISGASVLASSHDPNARSIRGAVYLDVNLDGQCVNTGVEGEVAVEGIPIEFVSSDAATVITLQTGSDGTYGLVAVGDSVWQVTAKPDAAKYIVTSENPLSVPIFDDTPVQTDVNFCIAGGSGTTANGVIVLPPPVVLPESGASAASSSGLMANMSNLIVLITAVFGFALFILGMGLEWQRRKIEIKD